MKVLVTLVFAGLFLFHRLPAQSQKKYALLIGINDYYEAKGVKSKESLRGPVNDANSIRDLLISKFGYSTANIDTIYNEMATRDNIIEGLKKKIKQCKPGDVMVFYYSGHGVWMDNSELDKDPVKKGYSQAMMTSDLYSFRNNLKCFVRDVTIKEYFNLFIDKKVILTALFDCCFSGNLSMAGNEFTAGEYIKDKSVDFGDLMSRLTEGSPDPELLLDSIAGKSIVTPPGCTLDASGQVIDKRDSDGDGVPDCKDKQLLTPKECFPTDKDGIGKCSLDFMVQKALNKNDITEISSAPEVSNQDALEKAFTLHTQLRIAERDTIVRPTDRKNSKYLFISATTDSQRGLEFANEDKVIHGLFTAALLRAFKTGTADMTVEELFQKVKADVDGFKKNQTPTIRSDPGRQKGNLIGIKIK